MNVGLEIRVRILDAPGGDVVADCRLFRGREAISQPYSFEVSFESDTDLTGVSLTGNRAWAWVKAWGKDATFVGVVLEFRVNDQPTTSGYAYSAVIGPRLSLLDLSVQTEVFGTKDPLKIKDLVSDILAGTTTSTTGGHGQTLDVEVRDTFPDFSRTNITKYNESDLQFISRVCENFGAFYYFTSIGSTSDKSMKEKLIVGGANSDFPAPFQLKFKPLSTTTEMNDAVVFSLTKVSKPLLKKFSVRNYTEDSATNLLASSTETADGVGGVIEYGDRYQDTTEGQTLANIRAAELAWQSNLFEGESTLTRLRAGLEFELTEHPVSGFNTTYIVVSATHETAPDKSGYTNKFVAIPATQTFRPKRVTPRPVMAGVFNAFVDASGTPKRAILDDKGRYRVNFQYNDGSSAKDASAGNRSAPLRQIQPYAGSNSGVHMPLIKDSEVLVSYVNGDPDRPVIVGAAFNGKTADIVTSTSNTVNRVRTTAGTLLEMNDGASDTDPRYFRVDVPKAVGDSPPSGNYFRLGGSSSDEQNAKSGLTYTTSTVVSTENSNYKGPSEDASSSKTAKTKETATPSAPIYSSGKGVLLYSEDDLDVNIVGAGLMKYGKGHTTETVTGDSTHKVASGQYVLKTSNGVTIKAGGFDDAGNPTSGADINITASNTVSTKSMGDTYSIIFGKSTKYTMGETFTVFLGFEQTIKGSISLTIQLSAVNTLTMGAATTITLGAKADLIIGQSAKFCMGAGDMKITTKDMKLTASDMKIASSDFKIVSGMDAKVVDVAFEDVGSKITNANASMEQLKSIMKNIDLAVEKYSSKTNFVTLENFL